MKIRFRPGFELEARDMKIFRELGRGNSKKAQKMIDELCARDRLQLHRWAPICLDAGFYGLARKLYFSIMAYEEHRNPRDLARVFRAGVATYCASAYGLDLEDYLALLAHGQQPEIRGNRLPNEVANDDELTGALVWQFRLLSQLSSENALDFVRVVHLSNPRLLDDVVEILKGRIDELAPASPKRAHFVEALQLLKLP